MEIRNFSDILRKAATGDHDSMEALISRYMPLINRHSFVDGKFDEDLRQYIMMRIIMQLPQFDTDIGK